MITKEVEIYFFDILHDDKIFKCLVKDGQIKLLEGLAFPPMENLEKEKNIAGAITLGTTRPTVASFLRKKNSRK